MKFGSRILKVHVFKVPPGWIGSAWAFAGLKALTLPRENPASALQELGFILDRAGSPEGSRKNVAAKGSKTKQSQKNNITDMLPSVACNDKMDFYNDPPEKLRKHPVPYKLLQSELEIYFCGNSGSFSVPLDLSGYTPFQLQVLAVVAGIPYGTVRSYRWVAEECGSPGAARAVGGVMRRNRTPLVIPCHRVIAHNGSLGGFSGGLKMKRYLLELEGVKGFY